MKKKLKILFVSSECAPYARTGGLGDVSSALPRALSDENVSVIRVMPLYRSVKCDLKYKTDFSVKMGNLYQSCIVKWDSSDNKLPTYFIENDMYFNRDKLYGYYEDGERFLFFCKAVIEMLNHITFKPDIIHCNDWHTGLIPLLLKSKDMNIKSVYTIHNLKYTGFISEDYLEEYNISRDYLEQIGCPGPLDFTKAGILYSDHITTVSREYAREIKTYEFGGEYSDILLERKEKLKGILNGIDIEYFSPETALVPYNISNLNGKGENKKLLREDLGLLDEEVPIVSVVSRLDSEKGIDLIINAVRKTDIKGFQLIILGSGSREYEDEVLRISSMYPGRMKAVIGFDTELSKRIFAGSDIFLMPSKSEAGGLGHLNAMAYGTVPVVRSVGGLKDTVIDAGTNREKGNGFSFEKYSVSALIESLNCAIDSYSKPTWKKLMKNCMAYDKSWKTSVGNYIELYKSIL